MRHALIALLAAIPTFAIAAPGDVPKADGGFVNRQTGVESWPYTGPTWDVRALPVAPGQNPPPLAVMLPKADTTCRLAPDRVRVICGNER